MKEPRGIRNNNPTNIRKGDNWDGLDWEKTDKESAFCVFTHSKWGIRAFCRLMMTYQRRYGIDTIEGIITRFAPSSENDTKSYIESVCDRMGRKPNEHLKLTFDELKNLLKAVIRHENGKQPYSDNELADGITLAGIM